MKRETLIQDLNNVEECLERTSGRSDIWQDRIIYNLALAVWHLLQKEMHS